MTTRQTLRINQGETWSYTYTHAPGGSAVDLTGYSARMGVASVYGAAPEAYLSTGADADGGSISLGGVNGTVTISMTAAQTDALVADVIAFDDEPKYGPEVRYMYDLELVSGVGAVTRILEGEFIIRRGLT